MTGVTEVRTHPQDVQFERQDEQSQASVIIETEWQFSLHVYGEDPTTVLRKLRASFHMLQANAPLIPDLIVHDFSQVRNVPDYVNEDWEPRAQMDVYLRGLTRDGVLVNTIEEIKVSVNREAN